MELRRSEEQGAAVKVRAKKRGGSVMPAKKKLVKRMVFDSIVESVASFLGHFCGGGGGGGHGYSNNEPLAKLPNNGGGIITVGAFKCKAFEEDRSSFRPLAR
ncbi:unnamed protein product [Linum trigynum]|uniref:Uncharacterized protein n=1 Tax=Linum trigynum TaxID=586398 RepID=A0AAV2D0W3_9ROSI